jgi:NADPH:quinone reductase-like Zn-dependent oxidoreductase
MSKAIRVERTGGPEALQWADVPVVQPGPGEALVRHTAIGVNSSTCIIAAVSIRCRCFRP